MVLNQEQGNLSGMFRSFLKWYETIKYSQWNEILNFSYANIMFFLMIITNYLICEHFEIIQWYLKCFIYFYGVEPWTW